MENMNIQKTEEKIDWCKCTHYRLASMSHYDKYWRCQDCWKITEKA